MIALSWDPGRQAGVLARTAQGGLADDGTLATSVLLSLFLDRRARADDALPDVAAGDRAGWIGDALAEDGDRIGSRLWLLQREKQTEETRRRAVEYAEEALAWLVTDRLALSVTVTAEWYARGLLALGVSLALPGGDRFVETYGVRL